MDESGVLLYRRHTFISSRDNAVVCQYLSPHFQADNIAKKCTADKRS